MHIKKGTVFDGFNGFGGKKIGFPKIFMLPSRMLKRCILLVLKLCTRCLYLRSKNLLTVSISVFIVIKIKLSYVKCIESIQIMYF